jgi:dCTP diphosphatase
MKNIDLDKLNKTIENFVHERDWNQFHSIKNLSMAMSVECSELLEIFQWMSEEESDSISQNLKLKHRLEDEVADVFVYLLRIISKADIDLEEVVLRKIKANGEKYPIEKARGNAKKYDDL